MSEDPTYPGTEGSTPTTDVSGPEGGGTHSGTASGANKRDPVSAGPTLGSTIAGRSEQLGTVAGVNNSGGGTRDSRAQGPVNQSGDDTSGEPRQPGGTTGREQGEGDDPSKGSAAENVNPGPAETGSPGAPS